MSYSTRIKERAIKLRTKGYSLTEISSFFKIAKSTSSLWLKDIDLNRMAQERLAKRHILGQYKAIKTSQLKRSKLKEIIRKETLASLKKIVLTKDLFKLLCSFLYWAEGAKSTDSYISFINSDPKMIAVFIKLLRNSFDLDERKFRAMIHIHEYHDEKFLLKYWSKITQIPIPQFSKSYKKPHTSRRIREGYQGSVRIRYYDAKIALRLRSFYNTFVEDIGL